MAFPASPVNGQTTTINSITYVFNSTLGVWSKQGVVSTASPVASVAGRTGAVTLTASDISAGTFPGALVASGTVQIQSLGVGVGASGSTGQILATGSITAFYSDIRLKTKVGQIENALDKIDQLTGILYTQNELAETFGYNDYTLQVGLNAQDVLIVQPEAVKPAPFDMNPDGSSKTGENYLTVQYEKLIPLLVEGIKELRAELKEIKGLIK